MAHPSGPVRLQEEFRSLNEHWSPRIVAEANDWHIKIVRVQGVFLPHVHEVDEVFWVLDGELTMRMDRLPDAHLHAGELLVVPAGILHRPSAPEEALVALLEPAGVRNTGDVGGPRTVRDLWSVGAERDRAAGRG